MTIGSLISAPILDTRVKIAFIAAGSYVLTKEQVQAVDRGLQETRRLLGNTWNASGGQAIETVEKYREMRLVDGKGNTLESFTYPFEGMFIPHWQENLMAYWQKIRNEKEGNSSGETIEGGVERYQGYINRIKEHGHYTQLLTEEERRKLENFEIPITRTELSAKSEVIAAWDKNTGLFFRLQWRDTLFEVIRITEDDIVMKNSFYPKETNGEEITPKIHTWHIPRDIKKIQEINPKIHTWHIPRDIKKTLEDEEIKSYLLKRYKYVVDTMRCSLVRCRANYNQYYEVF